MNFPSLRKEQYKPISRFRVTCLTSKIILRLKKSFRKLLSDFSSLFNPVLEQYGTARNASSLYNPPINEGKVPLICERRYSPTKSMTWADCIYLMVISNRSTESTLCQFRLLYSIKVFLAVKRSCMTCLDI